MYPDLRALQDEAEGTANGCENNALSQEATAEVTVCRAERLRDRHLVPQALGADEAQVGRIRPGDEQQEPTGSEQEQERHAHVADYRVLERYHRPAQPHRVELRLGHIRESVWQGVDEALQVSLGLHERHPRLESSHRAGPEGANAGPRRRRPPEGQPDVGFGVREMETALQHSHDRIRTSVQLDRSPDQTGIGSVAPNPKVVAYEW